MASRAETAEDHFLLGASLSQQGNMSGAESAYRSCLQIQPDHLSALVNLGFVLGEMDRLDDARACYEQAVRLRPDVAEAHHNLGNVLREQGHLDRALACYGEALRLRPEYGKAHINRGIALVARGDIAPALESLARGVALMPTMADAHSSLGAALCCQLRFDEALACYDHALALKPDFAEAAWNRALIWLLLGDYERGWPAYEWRWRCKRTVALPPAGRPRWDGSPLEGRTILLHAEQGLGDTIQFVRYAPLVKARGGRVVLQCQGILRLLLARSPGIDELVNWGAEPPAFDVWAPLMSLPALFRTTVETIPVPRSYVFADPDLVAHWRRELAPVRGFRVGIVWQGSPRHPWDRHRSIPLEQFEPLARVPGVRLISLQKGAGSEQLRALAARFPVLSLGEQFNEDSGPFMDSAAVMANLDLVVTVDSAAHLAGAMGVPAWVALPYAPDWRWLLNRSDCVWYPSLRLFRQTRFGDWPGVIRLMSETLAEATQGWPRRQGPWIEATPDELLDRIAALEGRRGQNLSTAAELAALRAELVSRSAEFVELARRLQDASERIRALEAEHSFAPRANLS